MPWRFAIAVLAAYVVVGALAGVVWEWVWTPPAQFVQQHQLYYVDYSALRRVFDGTGLYVLVAAIASRAGRARGLRAHPPPRAAHPGLVILGSVLAALVMRQVGYALGPPDPAIAAAHAADGTRLRDHLQVAGVTPLLVWPMTSLFMVALTFFAWPGHSRVPTGATRRGTGPERVPRPTEAGRASPFDDAVKSARTPSTDGVAGIGSRGTSPAGGLFRSRGEHGMSDYQPPSGAPEYLDSGGGSPSCPTPQAADAQTAPRRRRRTPWIVAILAVLLLGGGAAWAVMSFFRQGAQPAEALPASTIAYVSVDLDPSGARRSTRSGPSNKFPAFKDQVGVSSTDDVRRKIGAGVRLRSRLRRGDLCRRHRALAR